MPDGVLVERGSADATFSEPSQPSMGSFVRRLAVSRRRKDSPGGVRVLRETCQQGDFQVLTT
jgi:hypothetical protein